MGERGSGLHFLNGLERVIALSRQGDTDATAQLFRILIPVATTLAARLTLTQQLLISDPDDIANSALKSLYLLLIDETFEFRGRETPRELWYLLLSMVQKKAVQKLRHESAKKRGAGWIRREYNPNQIEDPGCHPDWYCSESNNWLCQWVLEAMEGLGPLERSIVIMRLSSLTVPEIAGILGIGKSTVKRKLMMIAKDWMQASDLTDVPELVGQLTELRNLIDEEPA